MNYQDRNLIPLIYDLKEWWYKKCCHSFYHISQKPIALYIVSYFVLLLINHYIEKDLYYLYISKFVNNKFQ